ncbi:MAG TPA: 5'-3' exonuclease H3TH domain-containing protein [Candidatus Saccharimonadales bacterium]|nr:5'-3' exonuclease H3TH domain-containing protein [Candidatus Saccharimonadales bacterium]
MKKLLVFDGNAILHRAYHAYPPLTNPQGEQIQAVFGFFSMFLTVFADQNPDYVVVCFDRGAPTFRMNMYAGYHANRPRMADDFVPQVVMVHALLEKMNMQIFELDGYEADDLIGTIATEAVTKFNESVVIVTGDRDMLQLVNPQVQVLMPLLGFTKTALFDEAKVEEKYGVHPKQFIDYKALVGDASDGYPGVTGIGPKSAAKLLQEYGTFEHLYKSVASLPVKVGLKLATDAEQAVLAKQLATIVTNAPIQFDLTKCSREDFDIKALREEFKKQNFKSLLARLDAIFGKDTTMESNQGKDQLELL